MEGRHPKLLELKKKVENEFHEPVLVDTPYCESVRYRNKGSCDGCESQLGCTQVINLAMKDIAERFGLDFGGLDNGLFQ